MFKIASGPWERLFEGSFQKYLINVYSNPEKMLFVAVFETGGEKIKGVIAEFYKIYYAIGSVETFGETLPRELVVLTKHDAKQTLRFLAIGSGASYAEWKEEAVMQETDTLLSKLKSSSEMIRDVSKAYDLKLLDLRQAPEDARNAFFTHPLLVPTLSTNYHAPAVSAAASSLAAEQESGVKAVPGEVILGITREGNVVEEPLNLLLKTAVFDSTEIGRVQVLHVLIEGSLLSNMPSVIFDWNESFEGLGLPTKSPEKLKEFKLEIEPLGFPVKKFNPLSEIQANVNVLHPEGLLELFGISKESNAGKIIIQALGAKSHSGFQEVSETVMKMLLSTEITAYQQLKAVRILSLINQRYAKFFNGANNIEELSKNWLRGIGRASVIELKGLDLRQALLLTASVVKEMLFYYREKGVSKQARSMIFIPEISRLSRFYKNSLFKDLAKSLSELKDFGIGFAISSPKEIDIEDEIAKGIEAKFGIIMQNDIGVRLSNRKQYRVLLRPTISELKASA